MSKNTFGQNDNWESPQNNRLNTQEEKVYNKVHMRFCQEDWTCCLSYVCLPPKTLGSRKDGAGNKIQPQGSLV